MDEDDTSSVPLPVQIGPRAVRWPSAEIEAWIASRPRSTGDGVPGSSLAGRRVTAEGDAPSVDRHGHTAEDRERHRAAAREIALEREQEETFDALRELLPDNTPGALRGGLVALFTARGVPVPAVLRVCQSITSLPEWQTADPAIKAIATKKAGELIGRDAAAVVFGTFDRRTRTWQDAPTTDADPADDGALVQTFAELEADDGAMSEILFPALAYRSRAVLAFGHRGQSKTSVCTWAARELSRAGLKVLVVGGDDPHTWRAALPRMGAFLQNVSYARAADMARPGVLEKHAPDFDWIVINNWRTWGLATDPAFDFNGDTHAGAAAGRLVSLSDDDGPAVTVIANTGHRDQSRSKGSAALEEAVHATRNVRLDGELSIIEPAAKTREGIDRDTVTLRARLDPAGRPEAYWLESRGPGAPTPDPDGSTPPKGWGPRHAAFAGEWYATEPKPSARALAKALKAAGLGVRDAIVRDQFKALSSASGTHRDAPGRTHGSEAAEGASVRPDPREGRREAPAAPDAVVRPDPVPAFDSGAAFDDEGGTMETMDRDKLRAETLAMGSDFAAGGERADDRARSNVLSYLARIPDWEALAHALGLDADVMRWSDADWRALDKPDQPAPQPDPPGSRRWTDAAGNDRYLAPAAVLDRLPPALRERLMREAAA